MSEEMSRMSASRDRLRKEDVCMHSRAFSPMYATQRSTKERLPLLPDNKDVAVRRECSTAITKEKFC